MDKFEKKLTEWFEGVEEKEVNFLHEEIIEGVTLSKIYLVKTTEDIGWKNKPEIKSKFTLVRVFECFGYIEISIDFETSDILNITELVEMLNNYKRVSH